MENSFHLLKERVINSFFYDVSSQAAEYIFREPGKNLDEVAQEYREKGFSEVRLTKIAQYTQSAVANLISEENVPGLLKKSEQEITKKAIEKNIHLNKNLIEHYENSTGTWWYTKKMLDLNKVDKEDRLKERLKWINCLTEFYCGQPLFLEKTTQKDNITTPIKVPEKSSHFEQTKNQLIEEDLLKSLLQSGYLQCDLNR